MFQIVCDLVLDVPEVVVCLAALQAVSPSVLLAFEQWGHVDHSGVDCICRSSNRTRTYVHGIAGGGVPRCGPVRFPLCRKEQEHTGGCY